MYDVIRICLFAGIGVGYISGNMSTTVTGVLFLLLATNELVDYVSIVIEERREQEAQRPKSRKKTKKVNPIKKYGLQMMVFESIVGIVLYILWSNGVKLHSVVIVIAVLVAAFASILI